MWKILTRKNNNIYYIKNNILQEIMTYKYIRYA